MEKVAGEQGLALALFWPCSPTTFDTNLLIFIKIQTVVKSHSLMIGASNLAILTLSTCFSHFWYSLSYSP